MYMFTYILKRLAALVVAFLIIFVICFLLIRILPNELPTDKAKAQTEAARREALGYNRPLEQQLLIYIKRVFVDGDLGVSWRVDYMKDAGEIIAKRLPPTMMVNFYSMIVSVPIGIGLGIYAALRKNRWPDHLVSVLVILFISVPSYVYAFLVQYILGFRLSLFPLVASSLYDAGGSWVSGVMLKSLIMPVVALSFSTIALLTRSTRAELTEALTSDYMLLARTKGLKKSQATTRHALKNAMIPILPTIISEFIAILIGSLIIERIFSINGIGYLLIQSIELRDYDVFMATSMFYSLVSLSAMILVDLSFGFLDPRIRMGAR